MNAVVKAEPQQVAASIIQVIERAATNPDINIEKMERLLAMQERILTKNAESAFNEAMTAAQSEMSRVSADATNPSTRNSKYASYGQLDRHLRPIYTKHGFSLSFGTADDPPPDMVGVVCDVAHAGGFSKHYRINMPADGKGAKGGDVMTKTHATGAAVTYGMRYLLKMIFNVAVGEDDNDGNKPIERITEDQVKSVLALITEVNADRGAMLRYYKLKSIEDIPVQALPDVIAALERKRKR